MAKIGDTIRIISMDGEPQYTGRNGVITNIGSDCYHERYYRGTWGGLSVYPATDVIEVISSAD